jgi:hypothetical protein
LLAKQPPVRLGCLSWRDRIQLVNSVLFCVVGGILIVRFVRGPAPWAALLLGGLFLAFGIYRLALARRELRKRSHNDE